MNDFDLTALVNGAAAEYKGPGGTVYRGLTLQDVAEITAYAGAAAYEVEIAALKQGVWPRHYVRNTTSYSAAEQIALLSANVMIVGLGGLGGQTAIQLARMGVGRLTMMDCDVFDETNLNRQMLSVTETLGQPKVAAAHKTIAAVNPLVQIEVRHKAWESDMADLSLLRGHDVCVDCLDNLKTRVLLARACKEAGIPLVSASIGGFCGQLTVFWPSGEGPETVFGTFDDSLSREDSKGCEVSAGTPGPTAAAVASLQALEVGKVIAKPGTALHNAVLLLDFSGYNMQIIDFK